MLSPHILQLMKVSVNVCSAGCLSVICLCSPLQGVAVLGIALIAMGEELGSEMALRTFGHLVSHNSLSEMCQSAVAHELQNLLFDVFY